METQPTKRCNLAGCENDRPSPRALAAVQTPTAEMLTDHWNPQDARLRGDLAALHGVDPDLVFLTSGAMGAVRYAFEVFGVSAQHIGLLRPDWPGFRYFADRVGVRTSWLEHTRFPFQFEVDDVVRFVQYQGIDFVIISNPSAVTGRFWRRDEVDQLANACPQTMFVVDEADTIYPHLSSASLANDHRNVLFLESFSKFFGLSGLRIGYLVTPAAYVDDFDRTIDPIELTSLAIIAARESLTDTAYQHTTQREVEDNLAKVTAAVAQTPYRLAPRSQCFAAYLYGDETVTDPWIALGERGVDLVPASWFNLDRGGRLNLRNPNSIDRLVAALQRLPTSA
ncbi:aminotransferase class I/II-fold pyridoxal phosphate-dependent enzyme [Streptomyces sp. NBC_01233]|uniref:aminotransferase class I/II-fold pyridoxal phosphate-dependent enzyme n=1 Tax=Streptomyces sp. NBC_01233 TaxID=2903787 RepID=UPI002E14E23E|nr:aminotransferase class I/II-fold pyridoxal phosphate-dependent enzyme [Streptomyces sp. NBC_01233]